MKKIIFQNTLFKAVAIIINDAFVLERLTFTRGFNKHQRLTKHVGYIAQRSQLLFYPKEEATNLNNVMDKYRLCSRESVHNSVINYHLFIACRS